MIRGQLISVLSQLARPFTEGDGTSLATITDVFSGGDANPQICAVLVLPPNRGPLALTLNVYSNRSDGGNEPLDNAVGFGFLYNDVGEATSTIVRKPPVHPERA